MPQVQDIAGSYWFRWLIVGLIGIVSGLAIYIFKAIKKDIGDLKKDQKIDHDKLNRVCTEHSVFHPENGNKSE